MAQIPYHLSCLSFHVTIHSSAALISFTRHPFRVAWDLTAFPVDGDQSPRIQEGEAVLIKAERDGGDMKEETHWRVREVHVQDEVYLVSNILPVRL